MIKRKILIGILSLTYGTVFSQNSIPTADDLSNSLSSNVDTLLEIINTIILVIIFGGGAYVIWGLIWKKELSRQILIGWVVAILFWAFLNEFLT